MTRQPLPVDAYSPILDSLDEIVYALDLRDGPTLTHAQVVFVNERVRDLLGYSPYDFVADRDLWFRLLHPEDVQAVVESSAEILETRKPGRRYFRLHQRRTNRYVWFEDNLVPQLDADGRVARAVGVARDVTARRRLTQQLSVVLDMSRDGFFAFEHDGRCNYVNAAGAVLFRRPPADIVGRPLQDLLNEPEKSAFTANYRKAVETGAVVRSSGYCNSIQRWVDVSVFPSPDGVMVYFRDITEQRTSEQRFRTWIDDAPVALFRTAPNGVMLDANGTAAAMLGFAGRDALLSQRWTDLIARPPEPSDSWPDFTAVDQLTGLALELKRADGTPLPVLMNVRAVRDHVGKPVELLGSFEDRTDPVVLRNALLSSTQRYRTLFNDNLTPMVVSKLDGTVLSANRAFAQLVGVESADSLVGHSFTPFVAGQESYDALVSRTRHEGRIEREELTLTKDDGSAVRVLLSARIAPALDTAVVELSFVDIEDRSRARDELQNALAEREFLLRELHHRVKNNLQLISSLLSLALTDGSDPELHGFAQKTRDRIAAMAVVHEKLYHRESLGAVSLDDYLHSLVQGLGESHDARSRGIRLGVDGPSIQMGLDQTMRCGLIVNELVTNAIKHAFPKGHGAIDVHVIELADPPGARVIVEDTGVGLPANFSPARASTLGMQMIDTLTRQCGGTITWRTERGTTAQVDIPFEAARDRRARA